MRFKGKIIKSQAYYKFRQKAMIYSLITLTISYPIAVLFQLWFGFSDAAFIMYFLLIELVICYLTFAPQKEMLKEISTKYIILDTSRISIQDNRGKELEHYMIDEMDAGSLKFNVEPIDESSRAFWGELKGTLPRNHISFSWHGEEKRIDFMLDSHYGFNQIDKIKSLLKSNDLSISV